MIDIIGLGLGCGGYLTQEAVELLKGRRNVYLRTEKHPTVDAINAMNISYKTFDYLYESCSSFEEIYEKISDFIIDAAEKNGDVLYAVPGHPLVAENSVERILLKAGKKGINVKVHSAVSFLDAVITAIGRDPIKGLKIVDGLSLKTVKADKRCANIITQVYDRFIASDVKLGLMKIYSPETNIYFIKAAGVPDAETVRPIKLYELDMQKDIDHLTCLYIPPAGEDNDKYDLEDLLDVMSKLRGENGCPWDKEQTHESLRQYLIEECYEVIEAINKKDPDKLKEELGDVLLQVVFHAKIEEENDTFDIYDVIKGVCKKMILRHPHIFGSVKVKDAAEVLVNWDKIKKAEKGQKTQTEVLKDIPKELPALIRSAKVQSKAAKVGFDWDNVDDAMAKIYEELDELKEVYKSKELAKIIDETGDLLFACVNVARFLNVEPETALTGTIEKFIQRFEYIEKHASGAGKSMEDMTLAEMDKLWNEAKIHKN